MGRLRALASNAILENGEDERLQKNDQIFDNFRQFFDKPFKEAFSSIKIPAGAAASVGVSCWTIRVEDNNFENNNIRLFFIFRHP